MEREDGVNKVKTVQLSFMVDEKNKVLHTAFYPKIHLDDGQWAFIHDENAVGKMVNAPTRVEARKLGRDFLQRMKEKSVLEGVSNGG